MGKSSWTTIAGAVTGAVLASACCIVPVVVAALGVGSAGFASAFEQYRPYLLGLTALLLGAAFYLTYRRRRAVACGPDSTCHAGGPSRRHQLLLWAVTVVVIGVSSYPYWINAQATSAGGLGEGSGETMQLAITGMTCGGCAAHVQRALEKVPGVESAEVSHEEGKARVELAQEVPAQKLIDAVAGAGYQAALRTPENGSAAPTQSSDDRPEGE